MAVFEMLYFQNDINNAPKVRHKLCMLGYQIRLMYGAYLLAYLLYKKPLSLWANFTGLSISAFVLKP